MLVTAQNTGCLGLVGIGYRTKLAARYRLCVSGMDGTAELSKPGVWVLVKIYQAIIEQHAQYAS